MAESTRALLLRGFAVGVALCLWIAYWFVVGDFLVGLAPVPLLVGYALWRLVSSAAGAALVAVGLLLGLAFVYGLSSGTLLLVGAAVLVGTGLAAGLLARAARAA